MDGCRNSNLNITSYAITCRLSLSLDKLCIKQLLVLSHASLEVLASDADLVNTLCHQKGVLRFRVKMDLIVLCSRQHLQLSKHQQIGDDE